MRRDAVLELGSVPLPVVTARIDRFIAAGGKRPLPGYGVSRSRMFRGAVAAATWFRRLAETNLIASIISGLRYMSDAAHEF
jgi:hypothetical protein